MKLPVLGSTIAALVLFTLSASAEAAETRPTTAGRVEYAEQRTVQGDQVVKFTGDELEGVSGAPGASLMIRASGPVRTPLIRPRLNFVPELLKSVENL